ncbi:LysM and putative peptidoglycan-binding domain-containing protein 2 [Sciurus carolinensis]|uniref:LysM and putative peptidoglycan-binding domain-containing protein 2 n=1 Tax=Sciurus carolinensis TaxID=30640 RepID=A0AA41TA91_SCICA|nr:LysM and putative peptidoglycan-binding domain-containing protein 2 [Sciurus carolinensis]
MHGPQLPSSASCPPPPRNDQPQEEEAVAAEEAPPPWQLPDLATWAVPKVDSSPALSLREGGPGAPQSSAPSPPPPLHTAQLWLSLARTKTGSYGSTASVRAPLGAGVTQRLVEHRILAGDTLQGIALKYQVTKINC